MNFGRVAVREAIFPSSFHRYTYFRARGGRELGSSGSVWPITSGDHGFSLPFERATATNPAGCIVNRIENPRPFWVTVTSLTSLPLRYPDRA